MKLAALIPVLVVAVCALPAQAGEIKSSASAVLELFTSQGCSSCPPADALLEGFDAQPHLIALAYHVDYWDYTGWTDTFGTAANSDRQRAYAAAWNSNKIYTPELVVNGRKDVVGSRKPDIDGVVASSEKLPLPVTLVADGDMLDIEIGGEPGERPAGVWLVTFINKADAIIERGENAGKTLRYSQVVTGRHILGMWDPQAGARLKLPLDEVLTGKSDGAAILVQRERNGVPGPILGAASYVR